MTTPTTRRHPRSLAEAFPDERSPAAFGPYRAPWLQRVWPVVAWLALAALFAGLGVLLAWRG